MEAIEERRRAPRVEVNWPVTIFTPTETIEGETENISADGISICIEDPMPLGEMLRISFVPTGRAAIQVAGKITWSELYGIDEANRSIGMGICFIEIAKEDRRYLQEVVRSQGD